MQYKTDDLRIKEIKELTPPSHVLREFGLTEKAAKTVGETRQQIHRILHGADDRLVVIVGPVLDPRRQGGEGIRGASSPTCGRSSAAIC